MLRHYGEDATIYAGGTELLLAMRHRALSYAHLIDLKVIPGLNTVEAQNGTIAIGAACTHRSLEKSEILRERLSAFAELESQVANIRVRATGTLGGNLCFAEPHSDPATMLLVLDARVRIESADGAREIPIERLISGAYANNLAPGEILTRVFVPRMKPDQRAAYLKFQIHERPTLGLGIWLETPDQGRTFRAARVAVGCVSPFPSRVLTAESLLTGSRAEVEKRLPEAAALVAEGANLVDDHEGSAEYKRHLIGVFLRRAFMKAVSGDSLLKSERKKGRSS
jgi:carbon-monoxide dehydrogenase medium subunit